MENHHKITLWFSLKTCYYKTKTYEYIKMYVVHDFVHAWGRKITLLCKGGVKEERERHEKIKVRQ